VMMGQLNISPRSLRTAGEPPRMASVEFGTKSLL
jgi:hypothetical protein